MTREKTYYVTFWYGGYSIEHVAVSCTSKRAVRGIMNRQYGKQNIEIVSIELEEDR